jgi:hypothetical protein
VPIVMPPPPVHQVVADATAPVQRLVATRDVVDPLAGLSPSQRAVTGVFDPRPSTGTVAPRTADVAGATQSMLAAPMSNAPLDDSTPVTSTAQVLSLANDVLRSGYPELRGARLRIRTFNEDGFFFQCKPALANVVRKTSRDRYTIEVNPAALDGTLTAAAVRGVLAHEIAHGLNTHENGLCGFVALGMSFLSTSHLHKDERQTDLEAIARGYGDGLAAYRVWVYTKLTPEQLVVKQATYYQPDEIALMQQTLQASPDLIHTWRKTPPMMRADMLP